MAQLQEKYKGVDIFDEGIIGTGGGGISSSRGGRLDEVGKVRRWRFLLFQYRSRSLHQIITAPPYYVSHIPPHTQHRSASHTNIKPPLNSETRNSQLHASPSSAQTGNSPWAGQQTTTSACSSASAAESSSARTSASGWLVQVTLLYFSAMM